MRKLLLAVFCSCFYVGFGQQDSLVLTFNEYLGYVKKYHPVARQAQLTISIGQAELLKARGGFDPKLEGKYDRKDFQGTQYWRYWKSI